LAKSSVAIYANKAPQTTGPAFQQYDLTRDGTGLFLEVPKMANPTTAGTPATPNRLLTVKELAAHLSVAPSFIYRITTEERIPVIRIAGALRFDLSKVMAKLEGGAE
jgi:predicted DNA-binding transcriptional regulator AlpA